MYENEYVFGKNVIIRIEAEPVKKTDGGLIVPVGVTTDKLYDRGEVIGIGGEVVADIKVGTKLLFRKGRGLWLDDETIVVGEEDLLVTVK